MDDLLARAILTNTNQQSILNSRRKNHISFIALRLDSKVNYALKCLETNSPSIQGSKGIRQWPINICTSLIIIHKNNPYCRLRLDIQLNEPTNQNLINNPQSCLVNE